MSVAELPRRDHHHRCGIARCRGGRGAVDGVVDVLRAGVAVDVASLSCRSGLAGVGLVLGF